MKLGQRRGLQWRKPALFPQYNLRGVLTASPSRMKGKGARALRLLHLAQAGGCLPPGGRGAAYPVFSAKGERRASNAVAQIGNITGRA
jgi:hypothetical protein